MKEKRQFVRFDVPLKVEFILNAKGKFLSDGEAIDFSREGLKITVPFFSGTKEMICMKIYLSGNSVPVYLQGKVMWQQFDEKEWQMGVKIAEINPTDKSEILDYIYKIWRKKNNGKRI
jgi:c-di-GMP-binding flagellar brake protein YcgR